MQEEFPGGPVLVIGTLVVSLGCLGLGVGAITSMDFLFFLCRFTTLPKLINYVCFDNLFVSKRLIEKSLTDQL